MFKCSLWWCSLPFSVVVDVVALLQQSTDSPVRPSPGSGPLKNIPDERCSFSRAVINGSLIESTSYVRNMQRNNFTVRTSSGFALVEEFFGDQATSQVQARVRVLVPHHNPSFEKAPLISGFLR